MASSPTALITADSGPALAPGGFGSMGLRSHAYMGCLRADGRGRLLASYTFQSYDTATSATSAVLGGDYAALVINNVDEHYGGASNKVEVFDLRTGTQVPDRGGESIGCPFSCSIDPLLLGSDAVSAAHTVSGSGSSKVEEIQASDSTGVHTLDSITEPDTSPTALTNLTLTGDTLTWEHNGTPESAQLQP
jgi:hypothetical protein